ncbi:MAG: hypothetical protein IPJ66_01650 [Bacteroidetes bacterium]|nr:hypothetical protein [Bacteroidota bacterium]MBL0064526.1 hypothetical protein [Bacteroidota bacterium]MBL0137546.1 hypothetical protein [Bacteroidota bacterium]
MADLNIYELFLKMEEDDIILSFKGDITQELLASVYQIMEARLESEKEEPKRKKKFYHILVECLQNVYHHMVDLKEEHGPDAMESTAIFMIGYGPQNSYRIVTGNFIAKEYVDGLQKKLEYINTLSPEELRTEYLQQLSTTELSEKGGAGLGLIDMARKSGQKLEYKFYPVSDSHSFFSLGVTVH